MAPIAASSQSKTKLRAFQYNEKDDHTSLEAVVTEKENQNPELDATTLKMDPPPQPLSQRSATRDVRDCPQTPLGRLPLTELLASGDDTSRQHLNLTPIERVLWDNSPASQESAVSRSRRRKRAHSSSPASSSQDDTSHHFGVTRPHVDLQALQKALTTPKADPADDLWSRYSLRTGTVERRSPTAPAGFALTQLIHSSSPQTPASHLQNTEGTGLRRALSCIEWPTSAAKRRKLQLGGTYKDSNGGKATIEGGADTNEKSKASRVSFLVEKIHSGLSKPPALTKKPSPEPTRSSPQARKSNDSPRRLDLQSQESQAAIDDVATVLSQTAVTPKAQTPLHLVSSAEAIADLEKTDSSSEFADDDFDIEMLETVDATLKPVTPTKQKAASPKQGIIQPEVCRTVTTMHPREHIRKANQCGPAQDTERLSLLSFPSEISSSPAQALAPKNDEFDEEEDEVSAADLENVFAQYDTQPQQVAGDQISQPKRVDAMHPETATRVFRESIFGPKPATTTHIEVLSDDEDFGDESDFAQIAAECAEANLDKQVSQPQSSVRTVNFGSSMSQLAK